MGPTGTAGTNGTNGTNGIDGATGPAGDTGPNMVATSTDTNITGILKGNGSKVAKAVAGSDYITQEADNLDKVVSRGSSTTQEVTLGGLATIEANTGNIKTAGNLIVSGAGNSSFVGNVGIGTTDATNAKLDVNGNIRIRGTGTGLPTAGVSYRGVMYLLQGTPDKLYMCMAKNNGTDYHWVLIAIGE
jgi:hypothetical protein